MRDKVVSKECPQDSLVVSPHCLPKRNLLHDMVLGPRLDKVKEEVTEEQPSYRRKLEEANTSADDESESWIGSGVNGCRVQRRSVQGGKVGK